MDTFKLWLDWVEKNPQPLPTKQPFKTYDKAKDLAKELKTKFDKGMREAAEGHRVITQIKSKSSFKNKTQVRGKPPERVFDVLRGAILVDRKDQIEKVVERIKKIFIVKKVEHKTKPEIPFGYYGAVHVDIMINDMRCEIQIMTKKLWKCKLELDEIYRKYRGKQAPREEIEKSREAFRRSNEL